MRTFLPRRAGLTTRFPTQHSILMDLAVGRTFFLNRTVRGRYVFFSFDEREKQSNVQISKRSGMRNSFVRYMLNILYQKSAENARNRKQKKYRWGFCERCQVGDRHIPIGSHIDASMQDAFHLHRRDSAYALLVYQTTSKRESRRLITDEPGVDDEFIIPCPRGKVNHDLRTCIKRTQFQKAALFTDGEFLVIEGHIVVGNLRRMFGSPFWVDADGAVGVVEHSDARS